MKLKINNFWTKLLTMLLGLLGFACNHSKEQDDYIVYGPSLYGTPYRTFMITGKVTDQDNNPIEEAKLVIYRNEEQRIDTFLSQKDGSFVIKDDNAWDSTIPFVTFKEGYSKDSTKLIMDYQGGSGWFEGNCDINYNPVLTKLQNQEEEKEEEESSNTEDESK